MIVWPRNVRRVGRDETAAGAEGGGIYVRPWGPVTSYAIKGQYFSMKFSIFKIGKIQMGLCIWIIWKLRRGFLIRGGRGDLLFRENPGLTCPRILPSTCDSSRTRVKGGGRAEIKIVPFYQRGAPTWASVAANVPFPFSASLALSLSLFLPPSFFFSLSLALSLGNFLRECLTRWKICCVVIYARTRASTMR